MATSAEKRSILQSSKGQIVQIGYIYSGSSSPGGLPGFKVYDLKPDKVADIHPSHPDLFWAWDMKVAGMYPKAKTKQEQEELSKKTRKRFSLDRIAWMIVDGVKYDFRKDKTKVPRFVMDLNLDPGIPQNDVLTAEDEIPAGEVLSHPEKPKDEKAASERSMFIRRISRIASLMQLDSSC